MQPLQATSRGRVLAGWTLVFVGRCGHNCAGAHRSPGCVWNSTVTRVARAREGSLALVPRGQSASGEVKLGSQRSPLPIDCAGK